MANFLVVCGGTGRGILENRAEMKFTAALQVDVSQDEIEANDGVTFKVLLPIQGMDAGMINTVAMNEHVEQLDAKIRFRHPRRLRELLEEVDAKRKELEGMEEYDERRQYVEREIRLREFEIANIKLDLQRLPLRVKHVELARKITPPAAIRQGMSQSPSIGRAYIEREAPTQAVKTALRNMIKAMEPNDTEAVFWVVSSTCGGTGQGIYMHVMDLIRGMHENLGSVTLTIKSVRVGSLTYRGVGQDLQLNTLWGVLSDYGCIYEHSRLAKENSSRLQLHYYYIDLKDVGSGDSAVKQREKIVSSAFRGLVQKELNEQFDRVLSNLSKSPKCVFTRTGQWGYGFDDNAVYYQTLRQLKNRLESLVDVSTAAESVEKIEFSGLTELQGLLGKNASKIDGLVNVQSYETIKNFSIQANNLKDDSDTQVTDFFANNFTTIRDFVENTISSQLWNEIIGKGEIQLVGKDGSRSTISFSSNPILALGNLEYLRELKMAQQSFHLAMHSLKNKAGVPGLINEFVTLWNSIPDRRFALSLLKNDDEKVKSVRRNLDRLVELVVVMYRYRQLKDTAVKIIAKANTDLRKLKETISEEAKSIPTNLGADVTNASELEDVFGTKTWLEHLLVEVQGDINFSLKEGVFRKAVLMGAKGLTWEGLKTVLGVHVSSDYAAVVKTINEGMGNDPSYWWQGNTPDYDSVDKQFKFVYRVFPKLPPEVFAQLEAANIKWHEQNKRIAPTYIQSEDSDYGLSVYAVECIAVSDKEGINPSFNNIIQNLLPAIHGNQSVEANCLKSAGTTVYCPEDPTPTQPAYALKSFLQDKMRECMPIIWG